MTGLDNQKLELIRSSLKLCPDFPKKGITFMYLLFYLQLKKCLSIFFNFSDILGIFVNPEAHRALIDLIVSRVKGLGIKIDTVIGLEARGFLFGPQVALELQVPFIPVRKHGKLPGKVVKTDYDLEYGNIKTSYLIEIKFK
jgi:adenine phosphoribosyltransferase